MSRHHVTLPTLLQLEKGLSQISTVVLATKSWRWFGRSKLTSIFTICIGGSRLEAVYWIWFVGFLLFNSRHPNNDAANNPSCGSLLDSFYLYGLPEQTIVKWSKNFDTSTSFHNLVSVHHYGSWGRYLSSNSPWFKVILCLGHYLYSSRKDKRQRTQSWQ